MRITDRTLKALGCERVGDNGWMLKTRGYCLLWVWKTDPLVNHGKKTWEFYLSPEELANGIGHSVDHIGECFGMLADDMFEAGKEDRSHELCELLGLKCKQERD